MTQIVGKLVNEQKSKRESLSAGKHNAVKTDKFLDQASSSKSTHRDSDTKIAHSQVEFSGQYSPSVYNAQMGNTSSAITLKPTMANYSTRRPLTAAVDHRVTSAMLQSVHK